MVGNKNTLPTLQGNGNKNPLPAPYKYGFIFNEAGIEFDFIDKGNLSRVKNQQ